MKRDISVHFLLLMSAFSISLLPPCSACSLSTPHKLGWFDFLTGNNCGRTPREYQEIKLIYLLIIYPYLIEIILCMIVILQLNIQAQTGNPQVGQLSIIWRFHYDLCFADYYMIYIVENNLFGTPRY